MKDNKFKTIAIREGYQPTQEQEHSAAIFLTSSFRLIVLSKQLKGLTIKIKATYIQDSLTQALTPFKRN